jgi:hypothetical protein
MRLIGKALGGFAGAGSYLMLSRIWRTGDH